MPDQPPVQTPFDQLCLEVLKAIGKTLGQMNLYSAGHPAVKAIMTETVGMLSDILAQSPEGGVVYSVDHDKVIANGRIIGHLGALPNAVPATFARFKLNSIAFKPGVTVEELSALCQLAAMRPEAAKGVQAAQHLAAQGVSRIVLNEAVYAKVERVEQAPPPREAARPEEAPKVEAGRLARELSEKPLEDSIDTLVRVAVHDPKEQSLIKEAVLKRLRDDIERRVAEATAEIRQQKNLAENVAARTQAVVGNMGSGVVVVDDQGKVLMMNPEAEELFGVKMTEVAGKSLTENVKDEHLMALASEIATPSDRPVKEEVRVVGGQDSQRTLRASTAVVQNEAGKPVGMVSAISDKAKQRELDRMEREFVAHVTHELRAPLTSIRAALEILNGYFTGRLSDEERRMMENALRNTDRLEDLIKGILDFSKIESGQMTVHPTPVEAGKLARDAVESMQPWAMRKNVKLTIDEAPDLPKVSADVPRTVQVAVNLLSNAIKFTPKGGSIKVRVAPGSGQHSRFVLYSVTDSGPGIPKDQQERIFQKFVQIASGEQHVGGTGLGLAIAKALIHMQKGQLWVESEPGRGSTFLFTLPHHAAPAEGAPKPPPPPPPPWWKRLLGMK